MEAFYQMVDRCETIDLGFAGPKFTWTNMRMGLMNIQERLDREFCNQSWLELFPEVVVSHLPRTYSDHLPNLLQQGSKLQCRRESPFHFLKAWLHTPSFRRSYNGRGSRRGRP